jgi:hypothetical protein
MPLEGPNSSVDKATTGTMSRGGRARPLQFLTERERMLKFVVVYFRLNAIAATERSILDPCYGMWEEIR